MKLAVRSLGIWFIIWGLVANPVLAIEVEVLGTLSPKSMPVYQQTITDTIANYNQKRHQDNSSLLKRLPSPEVKELLQNHQTVPLPQIEQQGDSLFVTTQGVRIPEIKMDFWRQVITYRGKTFRINQNTPVDREIVRLADFLKKHVTKVERLNMGDEVSSTWWQDLIISSAWAVDPVTTTAVGAVALSGAEVAFALAGTTVFIFAAAGLIVLGSHVAMRLHGDYFAHKIVEEFNQKMVKQLERCQALPERGEQVSNASNDIRSLFSSYNRLADYRLYFNSKDAMIDLFPWRTKVTPAERAELSREHDCTDFGEKFIKIMNNYSWIDHELTPQIVENSCIHSQKMDQCLKGLGSTVYDGERGNQQKEYFGDRYQEKLKESSASDTTNQ